MALGQDGRQVQVETVVVEVCPLGCGVASKDCWKSDSRVLAASANLCRRHLRCPDQADEFRVELTAVEMRRVPAEPT
jgi:hypothetical protein